jgi:hypothetical protein
MDDDPRYPIAFLEKLNFRDLKLAKEGQENRSIRDQPNFGAMILFLAMVILVQPSLRLLVWLVAGTDVICSERKNIAGWLLMVDLFRDKILLVDC